MLHGVGRQLVVDQSGQRISTIFNSQAVFFDCLILGDETDMLSQNSDTQLPAHAVQQSTTEGLCYTMDEAHTSFIAFCLPTEYTYTESKLLVIHRLFCHINNQFHTPLKALHLLGYKYSCTEMHTRSNLSCKNYHALKVCMQQM